MRLVWTRHASNDRRAIREYIAQDSPKAAIALDSLFSEQATSLLTFPQMGRTGRVAHTHELVVHKNYILVYDIVEGTVRILRVLHAAQQQPFAVPK